MRTINRSAVALAFFAFAPGAEAADLDYGVADDWSAKLEYRYAAAPSFELSRIDEVRPGVNTRFGGF